MPRKVRCSPSYTAVSVRDGLAGQWQVPPPADNFPRSPHPQPWRAGGEARPGPAPLDTGASPRPPSGLAGDSAMDAAFIPTAPSASPPTPI